MPNIPRSHSPRTMMGHSSGEHITEPARGHAVKEEEWNKDSSDVAQQTTKEGLLLPTGHIVRHYEKNKMQLCEIMSNNENINDVPASKIRPLNSSEELY